MLLNEQRAVQAQQRLRSDIGTTAVFQAAAGTRTRMVSAGRQQQAGEVQKRSTMADGGGIALAQNSLEDVIQTHAGRCATAGRNTGYRLRSAAGRLPGRDRHR